MKCNFAVKKIVFAVVMAAMGFVSFGKTITVSYQADKDYANIQQAICNASEGDTILVYPGTYRAELNVENGFPPTP